MFTYTPLILNFRFRILFSFDAVVDPAAYGLYNNAGGSILLDALPAPSATMF